MNMQCKYVGATEYKYVDEVILCGRTQAFMAKFRGLKSGRANCKIYNTAREAAIKVDMYLIRHGKEPVNILKRK